MFYFLQQFKCIYQSKLNEIESLKLSSEEILQKKFDLSQEYIHDLAEQNIALVQTAEELRESAESRVSILEKLLQRTSTGYKEYMKKLKEYYEEFQTLAYGRLHLDSKLQVLEAKEVQMNEDICSLKIKNSELLHNTSILVQFINSARNKGTWDSSSTIFSCPSQDDISTTSNVNEKDVIIKRLQIDLNNLLRSRNDAQIKLLEKDCMIGSLQSQITELKHQLDIKEIEHDTFQKQKRKFMEIKELQATVAEMKISNELQCSLCGRNFICNSLSTLPNCYKQDDMKTCDKSGVVLPHDHNYEIDYTDGVGLQRLLAEFRDSLEQLKELKNENCKLKSELQLVKESAQEARHVLTQEIAERHDTIKILREELADQIEQHKESVQQLVLKAEIIKELRKEVKQFLNQINERNTDFENACRENDSLQQQLKNSNHEIQNQKLTISNLQDALVRQKQNPTVESSNGCVTGESSSFSKTQYSEIYDI